MCDGTRECGSTIPSVCVMGLESVVGLFLVCV